MTLPDDGTTRPFWTDTEDVLEAALAFNRAGLCVVPLRGKHPALVEWKKYQTTRPAEQDIENWHKSGLLTDVGVVCGAISNNTVVLDFDGPGGYPAFTATFPDLVETFTVATGGGVGKHVYLRVARLPPTTKAMQTPIGNIELRSDGAYVVAPPSRHPQTKQLYRVEKRLSVLRVQNLDEVSKWLMAFAPARPTANWQPPREAQAVENGINPTLIEAIAEDLRNRGARQQKEWLNCSCIYPERHQHGDRNPSFGFNTVSGFGYCYRCGTILAKDICDRLGIDPRDHGGLLKSPVPLPVRSLPAIPMSASSPTPPDAGLPALSDLDLPGWLREYVSWASRVGNQTPEIFHLGMGIWMAAVAIARRVYADARWGVRVFPNLYMMFVADTTFYRKTTAYKLGEQILTAAIPQMLMPTPGSPERFQDAMAGHAPSNFSQLSQEHQRIVLEAQKFAAQRGLFKDEIAGLFGAFKRDYMIGLKDFLLEVYDCPDYIAKETQAGLAVVRNAAPSILGVTTPAGLSGAITIADWDNGLIPRFALLTPEPEYRERPALDQPEAPPESIVAGLKQLHAALPMPEKSADGWDAAEALKMEVEVWPACQEYSNHLRIQCDPRLETPLDDRLKGVYGRMHVQAMKVAMICATLEWAETDHAIPPIVSERHWGVGRAIAEHWRLSAHRLLEHLDRSGSARTELRLQDKLLRSIRAAGADGATLHSLYRNHNLQAALARQVAKDLVQAGQIAETRIGRAEAYVAAEFVGAASR